MVDERGGNLERSTARKNTVRLYLKKISKKKKGADHALGAKL